MRKFAFLTVVSLAFTLFAQEQTQEAVQLEGQVAETQTQSEAGVLQQQMFEMEKKFQAQQEAFQQQLAELTQKLEEATAPVVVEELDVVEEVVVLEPVVEKKETKYPKIKQSADINFIPRIETNVAKDANGDKREDLMNGNVRRLIMAWSYRFVAQVNDKLELGFRLSDPSGGIGGTVAGSGKSGKLGSESLLIPALPNVYFTWKPASAFNLSGGLVNVASNTALDLASVAITKDPTSSFTATFHNSLAGFDFSFPFASSKVYVIAGLADNANWSRDPILGTDSYSDGKLIVGANLSFAENRISLKPAVQVITRGDTANGLFDSDTRPLVSEGLDMGFKMSDFYSLNLGVGAAHDWYHDSGDKFTLVSFSAEPVFFFGGENGKLFNFRAKYALFTYGNTEDDDADKALVHHVDTRFAIAINEKLSIVPRYRLWAGNASNAANDTWFVTPTDNNESAKIFNRFELGFAASF